MVAPAIAIFAAALAVAPQDRMALADRLFARGMYAEALAEYKAVKDEPSVPQDGILFRLAECGRMLGRGDVARKIYGTLLEKFPQSRFADESRLHRALAGSPSDRLAELPALDSDRVSPQVRASALYHLARERNDAATFLRAAKTLPGGPYAAPSRFAAASIQARDASAAKRREATALFLELAASKDPAMAEEALAAAAALAYSEKRWGESAALHLRLLSLYPSGKRSASARAAAAWSCYLAARYADCLAVCGDSPADDDLMYLRAASLAAADSRDASLATYARYLERFPAGRHRAAAETAVCRAKFDEAAKAGDTAAAVEYARRAAAASKEPGDALRLAWAHERAGSQDKALQVYSAIASSGGGDPAVGEAIFMKAMMDVRAGRREEACRALEDFTRRFPSSPRNAEALCWLGLSTVQLGHDEKGAAILEKAAAMPLAPDLSREAELALADVDARSGRTAAAAARYAKLLESGAGARMSSSKLAAVSKLLAAEKDYQSAVSAAKTLAARDKVGQWAQIAAALEGEAEEARGAFQAAKTAYRRARSVGAETPEGARAALALGILDVKSGEWDEAERMLRDAVKLHAGPEGAGARALAYLNLAEACAGRGDAKNAMAYATIVTELFDDDALAKRARAVMERCSGKDGGK